LVVVQGARHGHAIRRARVDGGGVGDVAVGAGLKRANGQRDGRQKECCP